MFSMVVLFNKKHEIFIDIGLREDYLWSILGLGLMLDYYPSERSELRYRVQGVPFHVGYPLSPPRGLHWEGFKA